MTSILDEAKNLVHNDRRQDYEHPAIFFAKWAALLTILFADELQPGQTISKEKANLAMILFKVVRENSKHKHDNLADIAGYAETLHLIHEYQDVDNSVDSNSESANLKES